MKLWSKEEVKGMPVPAIHGILGCLQLVTPLKEGPNAKRAVKGDFHACCHGNERKPEKTCHHGHHQKVWLGMCRAKSMHELGTPIIYYPEFFHARKTLEEGLCTP